MEKQFERYFGKNVISKIYVGGIALIAIGIIITFVYSAFYGIPFAAVGVLVFFITSAFKVSDSDIDSVVAKKSEEYGNEKIEGKIFEKKALEAKDFSVFSGFYCDSNDVKFKSGRDGKVRTSRCFITAISVSSDVAHIYTTDYDLLADAECGNSEAHIHKGTVVSVKKTESEFPSGIFLIELIFGSEGEQKRIKFFMPDDALADKLLTDIERCK